MNAVKPTVRPSRQLSYGQRVAAKADGDRGVVIDTNYYSFTGCDLRVAWDQGIDTWTEHSSVRKDNST